MNFNVGDKVKFVGSSWFINEGDVGVILDFDLPKELSYTVDFGRLTAMSRAFGDDIWTCGEDELELVE